MTSIAWKAGLLAADSQTTLGDSLLRLRRKIKHLKKTIGGKDANLAVDIDFVFALSGRCDSMIKLERAFNIGFDPFDENLDPINDVEELEGLGGLIFCQRRKKLGMIMGGMVLELDPNEPHACGSGREYALGAMHVGASAVKAVEAAIVYDVHSGGEVHHFRTSFRDHARDLQLAQRQFCQPNGWRV